MTNKNFSDDSGLPANSLAFPKRSSRGRLPDGAPNPVDVHIGRRIRQRRLLLEYSQEKIASQLGITFQQVQKYEHRFQPRQLFTAVGLLSGIGG